MNENGRGRSEGRLRRSISAKAAPQLDKAKLEVIRNMASQFLKTLRRKEMKKLMTVIVVMTVFGLGIFIATDAMAQRGRDGGGWSQGTDYDSNYNSQTIETLSGEVVSVDKLTPIKGMNPGVHAVVETDKETVSVHLGPGWYIENQDVQINPKDNIEVKGSRITFEGKPAIIAAEVTKGDEVLTLRDASGFPAWSGWRRR